MRRAGSSIAAVAQVDVRPEHGSPPEARSPDRGATSRFADGPPRRASRRESRPADREWPDRIRLCRPCDRAAEQLCDQLLAITNPQHRNAGVQDSALNRRAGIVVDAVGTARNDHAPRATQLVQRCSLGNTSDRNAEFTDLPRNEVTVLTAGVENRDLCASGGQSESYFRILSTMIFLALFISAWALGSASIACSTSGSVLIHTCGSHPR